MIYYTLLQNLSSAAVVIGVLRVKPLIWLQKILEKGELCRIKIINDNFQRSDVRRQCHQVRYKLTMELMIQHQMLVPTTTRGPVQLMVVRQEPVLVRDSHLKMYSRVKGNP